MSIESESLKIDQWVLVRYKETPRTKPSLGKAISRPATSNIGADNEISYRSTFKSHYRWPDPVERPIHGGSIHSSLDNHPGLDEFGNFPVFESSIAKSMLNARKIPSAVFLSPISDAPESKQVRMQFRTCKNHPTSISHSVEKNPVKVSCMTMERSSQTRFKLQLTEAHNVRFYDYGRSGPRADLSVVVEKSPLRYAAFRSSPTKLYHRKPLLDFVLEPQKSEHILEVGHERTGSPDLRDTLSTRPDCSLPDRFPPDGHPGSLYKSPVCRNEKCDVDTNTIAASVKQSGLSYSMMRSVVDRSSPEDQSYGLRLECPGLRASRSVSRTEFYDGAASALPDTRKPISAYVEQSGRRYAVFSSLVERIPSGRVSTDPSVPLNHEVRRQHLLKSRILAIRGPAPVVSRKLKRILNLE